MSPITFSPEICGLAAGYTFFLYIQVLQGATTSANVFFGDPRLVAVEISGAPIQ